MSTQGDSLENRLSITIEAPTVRSEFTEWEILRQLRGRPFRAGAVVTAILPGRCPELTWGHPVGVEEWPSVSLFSVASDGCSPSPVLLG